MCTCMLYELFFIDNVKCWLSCINTCACHVYFTINLLTHLLAYYWHHPFNGPLSRTTWVSRYKKGKTSLNLKEARYDGVLGCSGISWTTCKQSAPRSRQITTPTPHHSIFTGRTLFLMPSQQHQSSCQYYNKLVITGCMVAPALC